MSTMVPIIIAIVALASSVITWSLNERAKREADWQQRKLEHYKKLLNAMSDIAINSDNDAAREEFARATNTIALIASQEVIACLVDLHDEIGISNKKNFSVKRHDELLKLLLLAIRKDVNLSKKDQEDSFKFHLVASRYQKN
jgi:hypothetical protein